MWQPQCQMLKQNKCAYQFEYTLLISVAFPLKHIENVADTQIPDGVATNTGQSSNCLGR